MLLVSHWFWYIVFSLFSFCRYSVISVFIFFLTQSFKVLMLVLVQSNHTIYILCLLFRPVHVCVYVSKHVIFLWVLHKHLKRSSTLFSEYWVKQINLIIYIILFFYSLVYFWSFLWAEGDDLKPLHYFFFL